MAHACCKGPGYASPLEAMRAGEREKLAYVPVTTADHVKPDYVATIDVDPASATFSQVISRVEMPHLGDELHHSGWNACSSCTVSGLSRTHLILPALGSSRIYGACNQRSPAHREWPYRTELAATCHLALSNTDTCLGPQPWTWPPTPVPLAWTRCWSLMTS